MSENGDSNSGEFVGEARLERAASNENTVWFRISTRRKDSHGTVLLPGGAVLTRFQKNPVFLWMHKSRPKKGIDPHTPEPKDVIGRVINIDQNNEYIDAEVEFDVADEFARQCLNKVRRGFIRSVSVAFLDCVERVVQVTEELAALYEGSAVGEMLRLIDQWVMYELSLVIVGSNEDALQLLRAIPEEPEPKMVGQVEQAAPEPVPPEAARYPAQDIEVGNVSPDNRRTKMAKAAHLKDSYNRWQHRMAVGSHMDAAEGHMRLANEAHKVSGKDHPHVEIHRAIAGACLDNAEKMHSMIREYMGDDEAAEGGEEMRSAKVGERAVPECFDDDLKVRFAQVSKTVASTDVKTPTSLLRSVMKTDDADLIDARLTSNTMIEERYLELKQKQTTSAEQAIDVERERSVKELEEKQLVTPAVAKRIREERWSLAKVASLAAAQERMGPPVVITATRPLHAVEGGAAKTDGGERQVVQPKAVDKDDTVIRDDARSVLNDIADRLKLDPAKLARTFAENAR